MRFLVVHPTPHAPSRAAGRWWDVAPIWIWGGQFLVLGFSDSTCAHGPGRLDLYLEIAQNLAAVGYWADAHVVWFRAHDYAERHGLELPQPLR